MMIVCLSVGQAVSLSDDLEILTGTTHSRRRSGFLSVYGGQMSSGGKEA